MEQTFSVTTAQRLDTFLATLLNLSRVKVAKLIVDGLVSVNGKKITKNGWLVQPEDRVHVNWSEELFEKVPVEVQPYDFPLDILYEDEQIMVVNKPNGLISHPTSFNESESLLGAALFHCNHQPVFLVHRLDRDTSGVIMLAKNQSSLLHLQKQLQQRVMKRYYLALVHFPLDSLSGTISAPLERVGNNKVMWKVGNSSNKAKNAFTKFTVLNQNEKAALIKCELLTGRTHQIRVHLQFIKHPVYNDPLYGLKGEQATEYGQYLHAQQISFIHPTLNKEMGFEAQLDKTFSDKLDNLNLKIANSLYALFQ
ncbi:RluA family pseudouridine synthase [Mycoplasmoides pneumoniae]|uniref:Pseudouridine synthase n=3 Tax=Mycoplasmoides pneumoniae TaxID=2104 RepID=A0AAV5N7H8_MYCPM|nr:RluA family pseudouridine synthase [Mycoplasmoides pneumoniae]ADK87037.1 pseudouridine synthase, RluA family [Mycoplasmoides pneumoniae FH]ALA31127.1 pseudouridine synthase [Mycoplasmoides pneumoniae 19294]ALA31573.1 pseudouridine synthase [Mycoplasmoides pneumoniae 39443]ALA35804.1 pseudouridine synthase [Mycoplasmoides pneumoniae FH]ALA36512.1 pseudouridine synthase [Mycoplasmoides pneumoniae M1139]